MSYSCLSLRQSLEMNQGEVQPHLVITEQPKEKGYRYRYKSEGLTHGGILGCTSEGDRKTFPTVEIRGYKGHAQITAQLVTVDHSPRLHPHSLTGKNCENGVCTVRCGPTDMTATFPNLGIQRVTKKNAEKTLTDRYLENARNEQNLSASDPLDRSVFDECCQRAKREAEAVSLTSVKIMFVAYLTPQDGQQNMLEPVVSDVILDCKATNLCPLKISRISRTSGSVSGNDEIWILCEKVQKDDIKIRFFEEQDDVEIWSAYGEFFPTDVHKQVAIVFKSPAYQDIMITQPVNVFIQLQRTSDNEVSSCQKFTYIPVTPVEDTAGSFAKAFTHGFVTNGPPKPKKKPHYKAPNPQKMPLDPTQLMSFQRQQQGTKRRRVEEQPAPTPQYWPQRYSGTTLMDNLLTVTNTVPQQFMQNVNNTSYQMQASNQNTPLYQTFQNTSQNSGVPGTSASTSITYTPMSAVSTTTIDHSALNNQQSMYNQNFSSQFVDLSVANQQNENDTDVSEQMLDHLSSFFNNDKDIRTDSVPPINGQAADDDEDDFLPSFPMDKIMSVQSDGVLENKINTLSVSDTKESEAEMSVDYRKSRIDHYLSVLCDRISRDELFSILTKSKQTLLHRAVSTNKKSLVKEMLEDNLININFPDRRGFSANHIAAFNNQADMLELLLGYTDVTSLPYDFDGNSPLHIAAIADAQQCIAVMVANGYSVNIGNGHTGNTSLHIGVETKNLPLIKFLVEKCEANVEAQNYNGLTPLHIASGSDSIEIAQYLLKHDARTDAECSEVCDSSKNYDEEGYGMTPIDFAVSDQMRELLVADKQVVDDHDSNQSLDDSIELMDPLVRHQFCVLMNKSSSDRLKLARACGVDDKEMEKHKNQTEYLLDSYKGTISSLADHLTKIERSDASDLIKDDS